MNSGWAADHRIQTTVTIPKALTERVNVHVIYYYIFYNFRILNNFSNPMSGFSKVQWIVEVEGSIFSLFLWGYGCYPKEIFNFKDVVLSPQNYVL